MIKTIMENNNMIDLVESYFRSDYVKCFLTNYDELTSRNPNSHYFNSFGINFKEGKIVSVKFYAHVFGDLTKQEVLNFLPTYDDYFQFLKYKKKESEKFWVSNMGVAMELKFKRGQESPDTGFFYNLENSPNCYNQIGFPQSLPKEFQNRCIAIGINFEYEKKQTLFKRYYYFNQPTEINYFAKRFAMDLKEVNIVEYAESINNSKINVIFEGSNFSKIQRATNVFKIFTSNEEVLIKYLLKKFGLDSAAYGIYENKSTHAVYFFTPSQNKPESNFLYVNTIQKVIDNL